MFRIASVVFGLAIALVVALGPGGGGSAGALTTTPTNTTIPPSVPDAATFRDQLLALAMGNLDAQAAPNFNGFFPAWKTAYPGLGGDGSAIASKPGRVSTYHNLLNSKEPAGPANPTVIAFAVADSQGKCAGGVIHGFPKTDKSDKLSIAGACNAQAVVNQFEAGFTETPPPITTVPPSVTTIASVVPGPPATGNAPQSDGGLSTGLLLAVIAGLAGVGAVAATRAVRHS